MCGIIGEIRFDSKHPNIEFVQRGNQHQMNRGPDSQGIFQQKNVALGHTRLMIMDLSDASSQPLYDPALGLCTVFNGAIYNFREIRRELEACGYTFFSDGDTEVILKAYHAWGPDMLQRLNGMFAFAVWERDSGKIFIARDRLGIKPIYIQRNTKYFRFASQLTTLLLDFDYKPQVSPIGLNYYMNFHSIVPAPNTIIEGIEKILPGHYLEISPEGSVKQTRYWELNFSENASEVCRNTNEWKDALLQKLEKSVQRRNVSALDVGVLLSGGVDSSLLVGLLSKIGKTNISTFSIGFDNVANESGNEFEYSDIIARHYHTKHHKMMISEEELLEALPEAIKAMSEPMVSHDCVAFYLLSKKVKPHCSVVQSGQGADEVFGGYHWYPPMKNSTDPVNTYREAFFDRSFQEYLETVNTRWQTNDHAFDYVTKAFNHVQTNDPINKALHLDTTTMLIEDPVKRVDNMMMAGSLEARVPFLDHELVEFAATMPSSLKVCEDGKWILKEAARDIIPAEVIDRPKGYFPVPALKYLRGNVLETVKDALNSQKAKSRSLFSKPYMDKLISTPDEYITPLRGSKLWQLGLLELWLQNNGI